MHNKAKNHLEQYLIEIEGYLILTEGRRYYYEKIL